MLYFMKIEAVIHIQNRNIIEWYWHARVYMYLFGILLFSLPIAFDVKFWNEGIFKYKSMIMYILFL